MSERERGGEGGREGGRERKPGGASSIKPGSPPSLPWKFKDLCTSKRNYVRNVGGGQLKVIHVGAKERVHGSIFSHSMITYIYELGGGGGIGHERE